MYCLLRISLLKDVTSLSSQDKKLEEVRAKKETKEGGAETSEN
jgi:hypothetical protein